MMTLPDMTQEVIDLLEASFPTNVVVQPDDTFNSTGMDSLDILEFILVVEERFPEAHLDDYDPGGETSFRGVAEEVQRRLSA